MELVDKLYDLELLDTIYLVRPNQDKPSRQTNVRSCHLILDEVMLQSIEGLTFAR